eukprot:jgi/Astpho2/3586/fgenesh1_pg.00058_%23_2_t
MSRQLRRSWAGTSQPCCHSRPHHHRRAHKLATSAAAFGKGEIVEVKELKGVRIVPIELGEGKQRPEVQYLISWKDGLPDTWEPAQNLADNLLRDFEDRWWTACRKGDKKTIKALMQNGGRVLARTVDKDARSALHFLAAVGDPEPLQWLIEAGADVNQWDREGYTPLHMAVGYSRIPSVQVLIDAGADPERPDKKGRTVIALVEDLRKAMPLTAELMGRRSMLEQVMGVLTEKLYEEVEPVAILDSRTKQPEVADKEQEAAEKQHIVAQPREFLVKWPDQEEPEWVEQSYIAEDVIRDFEDHIEYAEAECITGMRQRGDSRRYQIRWKDDYPETWEPEEAVSEDLVRIWEEQQVQQQGSNCSAEHSNGASRPQQKQAPAFA